MSAISIDRILDERPTVPVEVVALVLGESLAYRQLGKPKRHAVVVHALREDQHLVDQFCGFCLVVRGFVWDSQKAVGHHPFHALHAHLGIPLVALRLVGFHAYSHSSGGYDTSVLQEPLLTCIDLNLGDVVVVLGVHPWESPALVPVQQHVDDVFYAHLSAEDVDDVTSATVVRVIRAQEHVGRPGAVATGGPAGGVEPQSLEPLGFEVSERPCTIKAAGVLNALELTPVDVGLVEGHLRLVEGDAGFRFEHLFGNFNAVVQAELLGKLMRDPEALIGRRVEAAILDHSSPRISGGHLLAAAYENPIGPEDADILGPEALEQAAALPELRSTPAGFVWQGRDFPAARVALRSTDSGSFTVIEQGTGSVLGLVERARAFSTIHEGAIYLHMGEAYLVRTLDLEAARALVEPFSGDYYTQAKRETETEIREELRREERLGVGLCFGRVSVTEQVVGYQRRSIQTQRAIDLTPLELPATSFETEAIWFCPTPEQLEGLEELPLLLGSLHAAEHTLIALLPLRAMCDRWDIGGLSTNLHAQTLQPTIFVYDGHAGGIGISERGYEGQAHWLMFLFEIMPRLEAIPPPHPEGTFAFFAPDQLPLTLMPRTDTEQLWPLFWKYRGGFFAAHCHCLSQDRFEWTLEETRERPPH